MSKFEGIIVWRNNRSWIVCRQNLIIYSRTPCIRIRNFPYAYWVFSCKRLDSGLILMTYEVKPNDQAAVVLLRRPSTLVNAGRIYYRVYAHLVLCCRGKSNNFTLGELRNRSLSFSLPVAYRTHYARPVENKERHGRRRMPWEIGEPTFRDYRSLSNYPSELISISQ